MSVRVSIIMAAYNAEKYISESIESVLDQTFSDWELIICNDGSVDATVAIVEKYSAGDSRIKLVSQANAGGASARNTAFLEAIGEYIVLLDADDRILPEKLEVQVSILLRQREVGVVYGDTWFCDANGKRIQLESERYPEQHKQGDLFVDFCCGNQMAVHSAMVRRSLVDASGGLHDPRKMQIADWDLWLRVAEKTIFVYLPDPVAEYRMHPMMSARQDDGRKQVLQREFNIARMEQLSRFSELSRRDLARIYFAHGRFCARWKVTTFSIKYYLKSWKYDPLNSKVYLALIALLARR